MNFLKIVFLTFFSFVSVFAQGQNSYELLEPGSELFDYKLIKPFTAKYKLTKNGEDFATAIVDLREYKTNGIDAFYLKWDMRFQSATVYDQVIFGKNTFKPIMQILPAGFAADLSTKINYYGDNSLLGGAIYAKKDTSVQLKADFKNSVFEGGMHHLFIASLSGRGKSNYKFYSGTEAGEIENLFEILEEDGENSVVKVKLTNLIGENEIVSELFLTNKPPYLIRRVTSPAIGINWELIELLREEAY